MSNSERGYPRYWLHDMTVYEQRYAQSGLRFYCTLTAWEHSPAKRAGYWCQLYQKPRKVERQRK
jgi:hypothetical protein